MFVCLFNLDLTNLVNSNGTDKNCVYSSKNNTIHDKYSVNFWRKKKSENIKFKHGCRPFHVQVDPDSIFFFILIRFNYAYGELRRNRCKLSFQFIRYGLKVKLKDIEPLQKKIAAFIQWIAWIDSTVQFLNLGEIRWIVFLY